MKRKIENSRIDDENQAKRIKAYENMLISNKMYMRRKNDYKNEEIGNRRDKVKNWSFFHNIAFNYEADLSFENIDLLNIGNMDIMCDHCGAQRFSREAPGICCYNGKVKLEAFRNPPKCLKELLDGNHEHSKHFKNNIISYNNAFSFTSFGTTVKF